MQLHNLMTKDQLINYIQISFISDNNKSKLISALNEGATIDDTQGVFEDFLIDKINEYGNQYDKAAADFELLAKELDREIESQEAILDKSLDEKLSVVNRADYDARNKIWNDYYAAIDKLDSSYEAKLKSTISKVIIDTV
jgi:hypothetical protein